MQKTNDTKSKCNCCKECLKKCKNRTTDWLLQRTDFEMYPAQHHLYYEEYEVKGIISKTKNDKVLYNYLKDNNLLGEKLCYLEIANKLLLKDDEYYLNKEEQNVDSVLDYLYWSYGNPDDADNLLRKYFEKEAIKDYKCNCKEHWMDKCWSRSRGFAMINFSENSEVLNIMPQWTKYAYLYSDYIELGRNDKTLTDFLSRKYDGEFCYLKIAEWIAKKTKHHLNCIEYDEEDLIDCIMSYLYIQYGDPRNKENLLRKNFIKEATKGCKCNCKESWEHTCNKYTERGLKYADDDLTMIPCLYVIYFTEYAKRGIISQQKNDEFLYEYICKNNLLEDDELCYYTLACRLCIRDSNDPLIKHETNFKFLIDYLVWSYGLPYDENNILRKALKNNNIIDISNHKYEPKEKKYSNNIITKNGYIRDAKVRELALQLANFQCKIDEKHETFISKATLRNFVESHHLIPMGYSNEFKFSIDNEANIIALCPNCHRLLHHGKFEDKKILLEMLYYKHIESLKKAGIEITLERLLEMYKG